LLKSDAWWGPTGNSNATLAPEAGELTEPTSIAGLHVIPAGPPAANFVDLLYSPRWVPLLEELRHQFDAILIDTPPLLALPDARILGRLADGVVLVIRANSTLREHALAARTTLDKDGIPLLGTILNDWKPSASSYGYYYDAGYAAHQRGSP
jgi:polysaccharide biosynthesis transport protein